MGTTFPERGETTYSTTREYQGDVEVDEEADSQEVQIDAQERSGHAGACIVRTTIQGGNMAGSINLPSDWVCNGRELKPEVGVTSANTWLFDGKEIKPKVSATSANTWVWNGTELKPKVGARRARTFVVGHLAGRSKS